MEENIQTKKKVKLIVIIPIAVVLIIIIIAMVYLLIPKETQIDTATETPAATETNANYAGKKILHVDSYHSGYEWSDGIAKGIEDILKDTGITLERIEMDTKRNSKEEFKKNAAIIVKQKIESMSPNVVIVSDDNAFKYVVQEYYKDADLPVVFCGLNWDANVYGAPYTNTAGMVEVALTNQIIEYLKQYSNEEKIGYLSANTTTEKKNLENYENLLDLSFEKTYFVNTMQEWKNAFTALQTEVDLVIFENSAGISDWDETEAESFAVKNTKIPIGTTNTWTMQSSLLGLTKVPEEQGVWSANAALEILNGKTPLEIGTTKNKQGKLILNLEIAEKLEVVFTPSMLKNAEIIGVEN
ncbi:ABC transporter substrate-binding protein [Candidatus Pacearchaeota archaeon]|nr:ABC transporter substrate-binding protein [Candidatus Pacearchaeota archaeon]